MSFLRANVWVIVVAVGLVDAYRGGPNFKQCMIFTQNVDPEEYNRLHPNIFWPTKPWKRWLTIDGCYAVCGTGFELWSLQDIVDRGSLWIVPGIILVTHFSFAPLEATNFLAVALHGIADPIDSIWSLLTRIEVHRQLKRQAAALLPSRATTARYHKDSFPNFNGRLIRFVIRLRVFDCLLNPIYDYYHPNPTSEEEHIATIAAAYEEHGCGNILNHIESYLREWKDRNGLSLGGPSLPASVMLAIKEASHELALGRRSSLLLTAIPVISLGVALASAINRTIRDTDRSDTRLTNETTHSVAVLSLSFVFIPIVMISGSLGSFATVTGAIRTIESLRRELRKCEIQLDDLFPPLVGSRCTEHARCHRGHGGEVTLKSWPHQAASHGMNSTYRPCKCVPCDTLLHSTSTQQHLEGPTSITHPPLTYFKGEKHTQLPLSLPRLRRLSANTRNSHRSRGLLRFYATAFVLLGASVPAIFLSASNHAHEHRIGVGCRTICWMLIAFFWVNSALIDWCIRKYVTNLRRQWQLTILKDTVLSLLVVLLVILVEIGVFNSCICRASFRSYVDLNPFNNSEWYQAHVLWGSLAPTFFICNVAMVLWILFKCGSPTSVLCRSQAQLQRDTVELAGEREKLELSPKKAVDSEGGPTT